GRQRGAAPARDGGVSGLRADLTGARGQTYCSRVCSTSVARARRQERPATASRPAVRAKVSAAGRRRGPDDGGALRARPAAAFEDLGEAERTMMRLYFGLEDGGPRTGRELAARFELDRRAVHDAIARSVARLLGRDTDDPSAPSVEAGGGAAPH